MHGWSVPDGPVPFAISQWLVGSNAGAGALSVDSAPDEAMTGASGTIEVSWAGLDADTRYVGAVYHVGDAMGRLRPDLMGVTPIGIDTTSPGG